MLDLQSTDTPMARSTKGKACFVAHTFSPYRCRETGAAFHRLLVYTIALTNIPSRALTGAITLIFQLLCISVRISYIQLHDRAIPGDV